MIMRRERGFSLIELLVAMAATLVVSAAIYGLLQSGNNAFRRQPEVIDRQQNIRLAMDVVSRDVLNAGSALPTFSQVFTRQEDYATDPGPCQDATGVNGCGIAGTIGASATRGEGDAGGDTSANTDVLEIVSTDERCPVLTVCNSSDSVAPGGAATYTTMDRLPACLALPGLVLLTDTNNFAVQSAAVNAAESVCPDTGSAVNNRGLDLSNALSPWAPGGTMYPPAELGAPSTFLYAAQVTRYMIAPAGDPIDKALPALWRSRSGRYTTGGDLGLLPGDTGFPGTGSPWQLVARGIEDLQVEYMAGDHVWRNLPPASAVGNWATLVRQVRITISARSGVQNVAGMRTAAGGGPVALRGQLTTTVSPRAVANALQMCLANTPKCDADTHIQ